MNAALSATFDRLCLASSRALWPGRVRIGSANYDASVVVGPGEAVVNAGGIQATEAVAVEISTDLLTTAPAIGTIIEDLGTGKRYEIFRVLEESCRWLIRAALFPA